MQAAIGNRLLSALTPADRPFEVRDTKLKGFILRVQPSGIMTYVCEYARGRRLVIGRVGVLTPAQARDRAVEILADVTKGIDPVAAKKAAKVHDFASYLAHEYGPWVQAHRKDGAATLARLKACFPDLSRKKLAEITPWLVEKWRAARLKSGIQPATVNRDLVALKSCLSKAVEWGLLEAHPLTPVKPSKVDHAPKVRFLDVDEEARLRAALDAREERIRSERDSANAWRRVRGYEPLADLRALPFVDYLKPLVLVAINTGLRRGELFSLAWDHVDLERALLTVGGATAKSGWTRHVPLNAEASNTLEDWRSQAGEPAGLVFPGKDGRRLTSIKTAWRVLMTAAGIPDFRFHDTRHHFASRLVMAGVDLNTVRELLGHSDIKMTLRYAHLAPEHKALAVSRLVRTNDFDNQAGQVSRLPAKVKP